MNLEECLPPAIRDASTVQTIEAGQTLFAQGSPTVGVFEVLKGRMRLARTHASGHEAVLYVARAGDPLAEASILSKVYHCEATAVTRSTVRLYPKGLLLPEFERNPHFAAAYTAMLARQLMTARTLVERLSMHSARDRIRHFLILNLGQDGRSVQLAGTLKELAAELGLTHEVLYRTLARMAEDGEIERSGSSIVLLRAP